MDNIFTPEEANMPVTYGILLQVLESIRPAIESRDKALDDLNDAIQVITDALVDAEYKRVRDMRYILSYLAQDRLYNRDKFYNTYIEWCKEYDRLNKSNHNSGKTVEENKE